MTLASLNPASGKLIATYDEMTSGEVDEILTGCHDTFLEWS